MADARYVLITLTLLLYGRTWVHYRPNALRLKMPLALGFLLVFETLHRRLVTSSARRRLLGGVLLTFVMGIIGYRFIDNAAHLGGLLSGMLYGIVVFPSSASVHRPRVLWIDRIAGALAGLVLCTGWMLALVKLAQ